MWKLGEMDTFLEECTLPNLTTKSIENYNRLISTEKLEENYQTVYPTGPKHKHKKIPS